MKDTESVSLETLARGKRQGGKDDERVTLPHAASYWHVPLALVRTAVERSVVRSETDEQGKVWIRRSEFSRVKHWMFKRLPGG